MLQKLEPQRHLQWSNSTGKGNKIKKETNVTKSNKIVFSSQKEMIRHLTGKKFCIHRADKKVDTRISKVLITMINKKSLKTHNIWWYFTKDDSWLANRHIKKCSLEKPKSRWQWNTSHQWEWNISKTISTNCADRNVVKRKGSSI